MGSREVVEARAYAELQKYEPSQVDGVALERVLHKGGDLFLLTSKERVRIKGDTYFWELTEIIDGEKSMIMNDHPVMRESYRKAFPDFGGNILIGGLGIGLMFSYIKSYSSIDVIEKDENVIKMIAPYFAHMENVRIIGMDMLEFNPTKKYDFIYEDFFWRDCDGDERGAFDNKFSPHSKNVMHWEY
jgi:spermidine synthase